MSEFTLKIFNFDWHIWEILSPNFCLHQQTISFHQLLADHEIGIKRVDNNLYAICNDTFVPEASLSIVSHHVDTK